MDDAPPPQDFQRIPRGFCIAALIVLVPALVGTCILLTMIGLSDMSGLDSIVALPDWGAILGSLL